MEKSLGSDLEENKQTVLAVLAREENEKEWLHFNQQENTLIDFKNYFTSNGIRTKAENLVDNHYKLESPVSLQVFLFLQLHYL